MLVNAVTHERAFLWLTHLAGQLQVRIDYITANFCLFAVQGPKALGMLDGLIRPAPSSINYFTFIEALFLGQRIFLARHGYTGEPGGEMTVPLEPAGDIWRHLVAELGIVTGGWAARGTPRLEACLTL